MARMSGPVSPGAFFNQGICARQAKPLVAFKEGPRKWYDIKNQTDAETDIYLYDEISWFGVTAQDFINELNGIETEQINLHLNTPGGIVHDGIAIHNALLNHDASVHVLVDGWAVSIGSVIAMAGDKITMGMGAQMMIHNGHGVCIGDCDDMEDFAKVLRAANQNIAGFYMRRAGGDIDDWLAAMSAETWYNADEAVAAGLADEAKELEDSDAPKNNASWDVSIFNYKGREDAPAPTINVPTAFNRVLEGWISNG